MSEEVKVDRGANRLELVPAIGVYTFGKGEYLVRGRLGVTASVIGATPDGTETEPSFGLWSATGAQLELTIDDEEDCGPRSGRDLEYSSKLVTSGKQRVMLSNGALLGAVSGRTGWGDSGEKAGRLVLWKWRYEDIDEIRVGRIKKWWKMWDAELVIRCHNPDAVFSYSGYGSEAHTFSSWDSLAKGAKVDGSDVLGFAETLSRLVAERRGCEVERASSGGEKEMTAIFTFS